jgi:hypothetical protein
MKTWIIAVAVIAVIVVAGAGAYLFLNKPNGVLAIGVTDAPVNAGVSHVYLTVTKVILQGDDNSSVSYNLNSTKFDLLRLVNVTKFFGSNSVPAGNFTMITFTVVSAVATISGSNVTLTVPSGQVKVPVHFQIKPGKTTVVVLDISADMTNISASHNFRPVVTVKRVTGPG